MGFFSNIFASKEFENTLPELDISMLGTDIHSHLLPGIDDGATSIEESVNLIKALINMGYTKIITTPHINSDYYKNTPEIINGKLEEIKKVLLAENINIPILAAAEYLVDDNLEQEIKNNSLLTFGNKKYVLIEMSFYNPPHNLNSIIFNLEISGYKVVLAHPERYLYWSSELDKFKELKDRDVLFQSNLLSFTNYYSKDVRLLLEKLIAHNMVDFIGSDLHQTKYIDYTSEALKSSQLHRLVMSGRLLNNSL